MQLHKLTPLSHADRMVVDLLAAVLSHVAYSSPKQPHMNPVVGFSGTVTSLAQLEQQDSIGELPRSVAPTVLSCFDAYPCLLPRLSVSPPVALPL